MPDDFVSGKYIYENGIYKINPVYIAPLEDIQPTQEKRMAALEDAMQELILMQLGGE